MEDLFPFTSRHSVKTYADEYWSLISKHDREEEKRFEEELPPYRQQEFLNKAIFVRIATWKSARNRRHYESNPEEMIVRATRAAFAAGNDVEAIRALREPLKGVGLRTASALLHWMKPCRYPMLDFRVVAALKEREPDYENPAFYCRIADRLRSLSKELSVDLRTLDRALWTWHKDREKRGMNWVRLNNECEWK